MSKGIASANSLKRLAHEVGLFVKSWGDDYVRRHNAAGGEVWPAPYRLAAIKGEAVLRRQFFESFIPRLPHQPDASQQLALWDALVVQSGVLEDFINRIGIKAALRREAVLPEFRKDDTRMLYAIVCQAIEEWDRPEKRDLLVLAVDQLMLHQWRQSFAAHGDSQKTAKKKNTPKELREQLTLQLRKKYKAPVEIRESFIEHTNTSANPEIGIAFKILFRKGKNLPWETLVALTRPRVSTARLAAFATALKASGEH